MVRRIWSFRVVGFAVVYCCSLLLWIVWTSGPAWREGNTTKKKAESEIVEKVPVGDIESGVVCGASAGNKCET